MKKIFKVLLLLIVLAALGTGIYFGIQYLSSQNIRTEEDEADTEERKDLLADLTKRKEEIFNIDDFTNDVCYGVELTPETAEEYYHHGKNDSDCFMLYPNEEIIFTTDLSENYNWTGVDTLSEDVHSFVTFPLSSDVESFNVTASSTTGANEAGDGKMVEVETGTDDAKAFIMADGTSGGSTSFSIQLTYKDGTEETHTLNACFFSTEQSSPNDSLTYYFWSKTESGGTFTDDDLKSTISFSPDGYLKCLQEDYLSRQYVHHRKANLKSTEMKQFINYMNTYEKWMIFKNISEGGTWDDYYLEECLHGGASEHHGNKECVAFGGLIAMANYYSALDGCFPLEQTEVNGAIFLETSISEQDIYEIYENLYSEEAWAKIKDAYGKEGYATCTICGEEIKHEDGDIETVTRTIPSGDAGGSDLDMYYEGGTLREAETEHYLTKHQTDSDGNIVYINDLEDYPGLAFFENF